MCSALVGVAVIALPSGIITAAYMTEITKTKSKYEL
jgi:voltage-gated potassium channel